MSEEDIKKLDLKSKDILSENIENIGKLFPNVIVESKDGKKIDFDLLKQELSHDVVEGAKEKYQLTWPGKKEAILEANSQITKTLRPIREKSVDFENTKNIFIEGDNLEALKILQESYLGMIKCIYIDPPYNTGNDFIYRDNYERSEEEELRESGQIDEYNNRLVANTESDGKFHSVWLSMMYPRLKLARNLLTQDGVIFISIDDNEVGNLKKLCDEIFGGNNFIAQFVWKKTENIKMDSNYVSINTEYILCYKKNSIQEFNKNLSDEERYNYEDEKGKYYLRKLDSKSSSYSKGMDYVIEHEGVKYYAGGDYDNYIKRQNGGAKKKDCTWLWSKEKYLWGLENNEIVFKNGNIYNKERYDGIAKKPYINLFDEVSVQTAQKELDNLFGERIFDHPKPWQLIQDLLNLCINENDIVMDFFAGSATTAEAIFNINKNNRFILVQIPEKLNFKSNYKTICDIGEERIRRAASKVKEETNADIDYGFRVYKIDSSNMIDSYYKPKELEQAKLDIFEANIKPDRNSEDLLTQVILDCGLTLDLKIIEEQIKNNKVYFVDENALVACFDDKINVEMVDEICKINPLKIIFKEDSFKSDNEKINIKERIKKLSPETEVKEI